MLPREGRRYHGVRGVHDPVAVLGHQDDLQGTGGHVVGVRVLSYGSVVVDPDIDGVAADLGWGRPQEAGGVAASGGQVDAGVALLLAPRHRIADVERHIDPVGRFLSQHIAHGHVDVHGLVGVALGLGEGDRAAGYGQVGQELQHPH
ncbi:hypothetical protein DSECCO2_654870 [anaerobic digester metagenome]